MEKDNRQTKDEKYMRMALAEAHAAQEAGEIPVGAVVVCGDRIIARAHNLTETLHDVTAHAEMQAITAAADSLGGKYLKDCTLYVTVSRAQCVPERWDGRRCRGWYTAHLTTSAAIRSTRPPLSTQGQRSRQACSKTNAAG